MKLIVTYDVQGNIEDFSQALEDGDYIWLRELLNNSKTKIIETQLIEREGF